VRALDRIAVISLNEYDGMALNGWTVVSVELCNHGAMTLGIVKGSEEYYLSGYVEDVEPVYMCSYERLRLSSNLDGRPLSHASLKRISTVLKAMVEEHRRKEEAEAETRIHKLLGGTSFIKDGKLELDNVQLGAKDIDDLVDALENVREFVD